MAFLSNIKRKTYQAYADMKQRCFNPNCKQYPNYGGRGISVCLEWGASYRTFVRDVGLCPPGHSLDRIDVNGHYTPENCRWIPIAEQQANRRDCVLFAQDGITDTIEGWSRRTGIHPETIRSRRRRGWPKSRWLESPAIRNSQTENDSQSKH